MLFSLYAQAAPSLRWSLDDEALKNVYFPRHGAGALLSLGAYATDPSSERWEILESQHAVFSKASPSPSIEPSLRWALGLPLTSRATLEASSGTRVDLAYASTSLGDSLSSSATLRSLYQSYPFALTWEQNGWLASLRATLHQYSLQSRASLQGPASKGQWDASYEGSAWTGGFTLGFYWLSLGLDFSTPMPVQGSYSGDWKIPANQDPLTGLSSNGEKASAHSRSGKDSLTLSLPKQLHVRLGPSPRLQCDYTMRRGPYALSHSAPLDDDSYHWTRWIQGSLWARHQLLLKSVWPYGYFYAGALWLDGYATWKGASALLPSQDLFPQAGLGMTLGHPLRVLAGAELLPAIRIQLGVSYAP